MNPDNFGLNRPPFRSLSAYPGPQQLTLAGGLRRCLIAPDSVLVVTGPVGTGKTVSVRHALERLDGDTLVARIRRTHVDRHELLEQLLDEFGVDLRPESSLKRLTALHEVFRGPGDQRQVFIIVEDAERLGADVLAELESLTAADHDDSPGAHLILLGPPTLEAFLEDPLLLRLNQRIRRRTELAPFSASETRGYIEHCLREAGGSADDIIDADAIAVVHDCSGGVARMVNAIAEALLFSASERGVARIDRRFALRVAREDFGYIVSDGEVDEESGLIESDLAPNDAATGSDSADLPESQPGPASDVDTGQHRSARIPEITSEAAATSAAEVRTEPPSAPVATSDGDSTEDGSDDIEDTHTELPAISGIFTAPDHSATDTALGALRNATAPTKDEDADSRPDDSACGSGILEPVNPRPMSKSDDPADSQTIRALDDALRPDTQLLQTLDVVDEAPADATAAAPGDAGATMPAAETPASAPPRPEADTSMTGTMPTLCEDLIADALAEPEDRPAESTAGFLPSTEVAADVGQSPTEVTAAAEDDGIDLPTLSLEETGASPAAQDDIVESARLADSDSAADGQDNSLMPAITLDNALEERQQEQQTRLDEGQAAQATAAPSNDAGDESADEDEEQKRRLQTLAARFSEAKSLEDVMDDTAAETLFGEEFSAIAAAVTNMHKALGDTPDGQEEAAEAANSGAFVEAAGESRSPAVAPETTTPAAEPQSTAADTAPETATPGAAAAASSNGPASRPQVPPSADVDSSAMRRLEMVRALNKKAGKTPPPKPPVINGGPEEIVLGADNPGAANGGAAPERIENQFGPSMTNTLRQLSAENIRKMQEAEEAQEAKKSTKKGGLLGRFRRG